jgi:hypothetical protein
VPIAMAFGGLNHWLEVNQVQPNPYGLFIVYVLVSIGFGSAISKVLELPLLRFRDRLIPRRAKLGIAGNENVEKVQEPVVYGTTLVEVAE